MLNKIDLLNKTFLTVACFLAVLAVYFGFQIYFSYKNLSQNNTYPETFSVSADGKATITPDVAKIDLGITTEGAKVEQVVKENTEKMNALLSDIKVLGIASKDIQTKNYSLQPRYEYTQEGKRIPRGYTLNQSVEVKIRDFSKIGNVLEKAGQDGATNIGDLQFVIDDMEKAKTEARAKAIETAKAKAKTMAKQAGLKLKKITNIYESNNCGAYGCPYPTAMGGGEMTAKAMSSIAPTIETGQQEITVSITINYRVK